MLTFLSPYQKVNGKSADMVSLTTNSKADTSAKQIQFSVSIKEISIGLKNAEKPFLKGKLFADIRPDDCQWTLEGMPIKQVNDEFRVNVGDRQ